MRNITLGVLLPLFLKAAPLPSATSAQQAELYAPGWACILAKGKTANIYTDSWYAFGVAPDCEMRWKEEGFLTCSGDNIKNGLYVQELLDTIHLASCSGHNKVPGNSKLDFLEDKENHLVDISTKNTASKRTTNKISVLVQRDAPPMTTWKN